MNRFAFVTGADHGLGYAFAEGLLERGYSVFAGQYLADKGDLDQLGEKYPDQLTLVPLDISSSDSVTTAVEKARELTDRLDLLINNAAILGDIRAKVTEPLDIEEIQEVFNVNTLGTLRVTNALTPLILQSETKLIVNISSEAGSIATCWRESWFAYCMSKAALNMQSALIHNELKKLGGQVMVVHPGHVRSYMQGVLDEKGSLTPAESAGQILGLVGRHKEFMGDRPAFLNYKGEAMEW
ncbi:SDR family NAD(P)-dependent oxidoreductase [Paenibacillus sp. H1-7]|uniref:SDR family NAD(P)-dependent oxidoreductase n=1 Tax=Paenibacillus sp. H1-7 TaxID=2282849 RepID=UPI001EF7909B|nr:SDR family NAD(P)-dependent oxidoreductase [Paenibacillus sp. H1-7]ULL18477.1 SDR family NAD(P)-dependent oxidoreductase [Paenibacillus sp. H1-7]